MNHSKTLGAIAPALVVALAHLGAVPKDGTNPAFKRDGKAMAYATLDAVIGASREVLAANDLVLMQWPGALIDGKLALETVILHKSGEWVGGDFQIALGKTDPQGVGSALTYARRYAQKAALNIPDEDDDAELAGARNVQEGAAQDQRGNPRQEAQQTQQRRAGPSSNELRKEGAWERYMAEMKAQRNHEELKAWGAKVGPTINTWPKKWIDAFREEYQKYGKGLQASKSDAPPAEDDDGGAPR